ncbi:chloroplast envelope membrane protein [Vigna unguiculata]|uniref:chloroplast envelope membrane protein n=1 Tax=Vigna unguiculata TaxID=3917 RepID=UPI00101685EF|nr:chloroplast envelope membrane protein [Vigna unguiculata]XP_027925264.1 chloroplast envelope membrane protein [Vigna unguiculata]XP_027925265.1 chloroplast envelope membrane protein [Vigna unguiculata]XP_027925266.1 chloroplast envelope membrane protein [Vigna unguiculata]XP_027925267.1 chloroplast envelope membrane protein [Vigna unguiculata]
MFFMSSSTVLCDSLILFNQKLLLNSFVSHGSSNFVIQLGSKTRRLNGFISKAEKHSGHSRKSSWWQKFFFEDDGNWLGLRDDDMVETEAEAVAAGEAESTRELSEGEKFEAWKQRAEAIVELREAQEDRKNQEYRKWEDWLLDGDGINREGNTSSSDWEQGMKDYRDNVRDDSGDLPADKGLVESARYLIFGGEDEDMLYEDRVFQYASSNSAKFLALLIIVPWAMDFLVHDYILMPFLDRYVKTVPLAAQMLDVRRYQKLEIVEELKTERGRFELEVEIGKSPPLSDEEVWWELRHKALELREERRLENRRAFANIWSDTVYGISLFILLYFNKSKVALLKFTGYKIINNISDTGKAFLIILITDIFLGYHSESGWQTLLEIIVEHYGLEVDQSTITIFICLVPVVMDACVKLWLFKFLPRLSPRVTNIFQEMKRH